MKNVLSSDAIMRFKITRNSLANLVPRAFPFEIGRGWNFKGKSPGNEVVRLYHLRVALP